VKYKFVKRIRMSDGEEITLKVNSKKLKIRFSYHSLLRALKWNLSAAKIIRTLLDPDEVVVGHSGRFIAHKIYGAHLVRAVYEYKKKLPFLVTVYYPYKERYFEGGGKFADKIFP